MHPILCRILEKPVCAILDGCNNLFFKLNNAASSLFGPSQPKCSLLLKNNIKNCANEKPEPPKKPQRGIMRKPATFEKDMASSYDPDHFYRNQMDTYRFNRSVTQDNKHCDTVFEAVNWSPSKPKWLIIIQSLLSSMVQVRKVLLGKEALMLEDTDLYDSVVSVSRPSDQCKYLLRLVGIYPYPLLVDEKKDDDDYILIDGDEDDEYIPYL